MGEKGKEEKDVIVETRKLAECTAESSNTLRGCCSGPFVPCFLASDEWERKGRKRKA